MDKAYKVSAKRPDTGKWWTYGSLKKNKFDNLQIGLRVTPELKALIDANEGQWINFSLFEEEEKRETPEAAKAEIAKLQASVDEDTIPF